MQRLREKEREHAKIAKVRRESERREVNQKECVCCMQRSRERVCVRCMRIFLDAARKDKEPTLCDRLRS